MDINLLVKLTSRAWCLTILARLHEGAPGRQAPLLAATGASRTAFGASLEHLVQMRVLERNPGHGHPLRPEFRLTPLGVELAKTAHALSELVPDDTEFSVLRRNWTVPILALAKSPQRFSGFRSQLPNITDRALSQSLQGLEERDWLHRAIDTSARVPFPLYSAANTGKRIGSAINLAA